MISRSAATISVCPQRATSRRSGSSPDLRPASGGPAPRLPAELQKQVYLAGGRRLENVPTATPPRSHAEGALDRPRNLLAPNLFFCRGGAGGKDDRTARLADCIGEGCAREEAALVLRDHRGAATREEQAEAEEGCGGCCQFRQREHKENTGAVWCSLGVQLKTLVFFVQVCLGPGVHR